MCVYCMIADWGNHWVPSPNPWTPLPGGPIPYMDEWTREQFDEFVLILKEVKRMEDELGGCPCEDPTKLDYLKVIRNRLDVLEGKEPDPDREILISDG